MSGEAPRLLVVGSDGPAARSLVRLAQERGAVVVVATGPLPSEEDTERAFTAAADGASTVAGIVQVLAVPPAVARLGEWSFGEWDRAVLAGLRSAFLVARRTVEEFLAGGEGGRLVFLVAAEGPEGDAAREIVLGSLLAFVRSVAKEYGPKGIACNAVVAHPGGARDEELASETVWMLLAPEGAYVTGEVIDLAPGRQGSAPKSR